ncbi:hypothetical protein BRD01_15370 [Halobacteriales archaeon QS_8_65_32]|jgi:hypothetical protein|nr:MAG: hypothetical protein BRD01_15370 [Halobacteriales archaeon QS_8_65_32]
MKRGAGGSANLRNCPTEQASLGGIERGRPRGGGAITVSEVGGADLPLGVLVSERSEASESREELCSDRVHEGETLS